MTCACCGGRIARPFGDDDWEGRLDDYCYDCASARCDAYPGECGKDHIRAAPRWWWSPPWRLTDPWQVDVFRGGDEWGRNTLAAHLSLLGMFVVARGADA